MTIQVYINKLVERRKLTFKESRDVVEMMLDEELTLSQIAAILTALRTRGEEADEILGFIAGIKKDMISVKGRNVIDVCGTGGDGKKTFNISTAVAFVVAGVGVRVAKHGNRAVSSLCGSADVLETLGVNINLTQPQAEKILKEVGMVFLFAPLFHPTFKNIGSVRKELGIRTIFNYLGPFLNPANTKRQLIGVPSEELAVKLVEVSKKLHYKHLYIVVSRDGMDEVSTTTKTKVFENKNGHVSSFIIDPKKCDLYYSSKTVVSGGNAQKNAEIIKNILEGEKGPKRDIVVLNSAVALCVAGKAKNTKEGIAIAEKSLDTGRAKRVLENLIKETQKYA